MKRTETNAKLTCALGACMSVCVCGCVCASESEVKQTKTFQPASKRRMDGRIHAEQPKERTRQTQEAESKRERQRVSPKAKGACPSVCM